MPERIIPAEPKSPAEERAFDEGARARHAGQPISANPYNLDDNDESVLMCCAWRDGWQAAGRARKPRASKRASAKKPERAELTADDIRVGGMYRAKRFREFLGATNDRRVIWISPTRAQVQYDSHTVRIGGRYPTVAMDAFVRWASHELTEEAKRDGE